MVVQDSQVGDLAQRCPAPSGRRRRAAGPAHLMEEEPSRAVDHAVVVRLGDPAVPLEHEADQAKAGDRRAQQALSFLRLFLFLFSLLLLSRVVRHVPPPGKSDAPGPRREVDAGAGRGAPAPILSRRIRWLRSRAGISDNGERAGAFFLSRNRPATSLFGRCERTTRWVLAGDGAVV